jgi:putative SOS response-associated peptidase YedK
MCGRFVLVLNADEIQEEFGTEDAPSSWMPDYNVSPSKNIPVLTAENPLNWRFIKWGLNRNYNQQSRFIINIRKETLEEKNTFKHLLKNKRCLIPTSGFYEWKKEASQKKSSPFYFSILGDHPIAFAGVWDESTLENKQGAEFAIITCPANQVVSQVHGRMPVILDNEACKLWMSNIELGDALGLLKSYSNAKMNCIAVSQQVNNPSYNSKDCIEPIISGQQRLNFNDSRNF